VTQRNRASNSENGAITTFGRGPVESPAHSSEIDLLRISKAVRSLTLEGKWNFEFVMTKLGLAATISIAHRRFPVAVNIVCSRSERPALNRQTWSLW